LEEWRKTLKIRQKNAVAWQPANKEKKMTPKRTTMMSTRSENRRTTTTENGG